MSYNDNPRFIDDLAKTATHIIRVANQRQREQARIDRSVLGNKSGKVTKIFDSQKPIRPQSAQDIHDITSGDPLISDGAHVQTHGILHSTVAIPSILPASARPSSRAKTAFPKVSVSIKQEPETITSKVSKESIIDNLRGAVAKQALTLAPEDNPSDRAKTPSTSDKVKARVPYVYQKPKEAAETLKAFTATLVDFDRKIIPDVVLPPDPVGVEMLRKFPRPVSSATKTMRKLRDKRRGGAMRKADVGAKETTYHGLKKRFRSEEECQKKYDEYLERKKAGITGSITIDEDGIEEEDDVVERHPLWIHTMHIIHRENYWSRERSRRRLVARRFNLDVRDIWLSNLRHISEMKEIENAYTLAQGYDDDDEIPGQDDEEKQRQLTAFEVVKSKLSAVAEEVESMPDRGLTNRRDVKALEDMSYQIQSVSAARSMHGAFHTHYMPEPKLVLDYVCEPTPLLKPPPPLPPILDSLVYAYHMQAVSITLDEPLKSSKSNNNAHILAWKSKAAPVHHHEKVNKIKPMNEDVYLYIDRLIPEYDRSHQQLSSSSSSSDIGIFWRISVLRLGDVTFTYVLGKELEIADYIGSLWATENDEQVDSTDNGSKPKYDHEDELHPDILQDMEWIESHAGGKEPLTIIVYEESTAKIPIATHLYETVEELEESDISDTESPQPKPKYKQSTTASRSTKETMYQKDVNITIYVISKQGKMVPYCSSAISENEIFCRAHRSIDIEIHVRYPRSSTTMNHNANANANANGCTIALDGGNNGTSFQDYQELSEVIYEHTEGIETIEMNETVLVTSPIELRRLLNVPIAPLSDTAWWIHEARNDDIWPAVCSLIRLYPCEQEHEQDHEHEHEDHKTSDNDVPQYTLDFIRSKAQQKIINRTEGALSASQAYAIAQEVVTRLVVQYDRATKDMSLFMPGAPLSLLTGTSKRPRSSKSNKSRISSQFLDGGSWELMVSSVPSLSLAASGGVPLTSQVPGASEVGTRGFWLKPPRCYPNEETRVAATFFRDALVSTSNTVLVLLTHAIDVPILIPVSIGMKRVLFYGYSFFLSLLRVLFYG